MFGCTVIFGCGTVFDLEQWGGGGTGLKTNIWFIGSSLSGSQRQPSLQSCVLEVHTCKSRLLQKSRNSPGCPCSCPSGFTPDARSHMKRESMINIQEFVQQTSLRESFDLFPFSNKIADFMFLLHRADSACVHTSKSKSAKHLRIHQRETRPNVGRVCWNPCLCSPSLCSPSLSLSHTHSPTHRESV